MRLGEKIIKLSASNLALSANHNKAYIGKETENAPQYTLILNFSLFSQAL